MWPDAIRFLDRTDPTLADNLATDDRLLDEAQQQSGAACLRIWESTTYGVVLGKSNVIAQEVDEASCAADNVPIQRRSSGGGAVVVGPGCLCFTLVLPIPAEYPALGIAGVTRQLMQRLADAWSSSDHLLAVAGISDLTLAGRKVCGNAQRWKSQAFLHHGTLLYDFDLTRVSRYLRMPRRQPDYRAGRSHQEFVTNVTLPRQELVQRLAKLWNAQL
ncbi:MAG: hypothetical protein U0872_09640 [Planctomycetaceae bacterium]